MQPDPLSFSPEISSGINHCFYEGETCLDVVRKAVSLGGDSDTICLIYVARSIRQEQREEQWNSPKWAALFWSRVSEYVSTLEYTFEYIPERGVAEPPRIMFIAILYLFLVKGYAVMDAVDQCTSPYHLDGFRKDLTTASCYIVDQSDTA